MKHPVSYGSEAIPHTFPAALRFQVSSPDIYVLSVNGVCTKFHIKGLALSGTAVDLTLLV